MGLVTYVNKIYFPQNFGVIFSSSTYFCWMICVCLAADVCSNTRVGPRGLWEQNDGRQCQKCLSDYVWLQQCMHSPFPLCSENKCSWWPGKETTLSSYSTCTHPNPFPGGLPNCLNVLLWAWDILCYPSHLPLNPLLYAFWVVVCMSLFCFLYLTNSSDDKANW